METRTKTIGWSAGLTALLALTTVVCAAVGPVSIDYLTVAKVLLNQLALPTGVTLAGGLSLQTTPLFQFSVPKTASVIVASVRLPRIALAATVGFSLAAAGTVMQGFFRNPMADPSIVGVSSGAAVGAVSAIVLPLSVPFGIEGAAFVGAILTAFLVYALATERGRTPVATLLLAGVAIQTFLGAVVSFLLVTSGESLREALYWLMGDISAATWGDVTFAGGIGMVGFLLLLPYTNDMNVLLLGEEDAHHLGIAVERTKLLLLTLASIVTAAGVAVAGVIGFVGLVVPHMLRLVVGPDHRILLPTSALAGASFLVATDTVARSTAEVLPVGIVTAALGAPFFLFLLKRREVHAL
ncbi:vitamin B12 ABC transporter permease BtuC [Haloarchaeobius sp. DT45]|uniref:vitamin B12 ABC transporter permease BtuC n=1 Tax=Haloarchaeobius sp. DT45 TaxID=3446116 RepID=UPI003F6D3723